jgi:uncharacterized membrane protein
LSLTAPEPSAPDAEIAKIAAAMDLSETAGGAAATAPLPRMAMALLALIGLFISSYMLLFKLGLIGTLACGAGSCGVVQASSWAVFLGVPVPAWGVVGYALILAISLIGVQPRWAYDRRVGMVLFGLATTAFAFSVYLTAIEAFVLRAWCRWCVVSAVVATLIFICSLTEFRQVEE